MSTRVQLAPGAAPQRPMVLYDGHCRFCKAQMQNLIAMARPGAFDPVDFQAPGVLEGVPGLTHAMCMEEMKLVMPDGRIYGGMEAAVRAARTRPLLRLFAWVYFVPGIRQILDWGYRRIAERRYRIAARAPAAVCEGDACAVHFGEPS